MPTWDIALHVAIALLVLAASYRWGPQAKIFLQQRAHDRELLSLAASLNNAARQLQELDKVRADWQSRAETRAQHIAGLRAEADTWIRLHREETVGHGNAQVIMMDAVSFLERRLVQARHKYPDDPIFQIELPPIVRETQSLYTGRFLEPVLKETGGTVIHRDQNHANAPTGPATPPPAAPGTVTP
jgi:hypothetical protein